MSKPIYCRVCGDEVVFGDLLPTGAVCVDCGGQATATLEPEAPTHNPNEGGETSSVSMPPATEGVDNSASHAPRAAEDQTECEGEPAPQCLAGDRAESADIDISDLRSFDARRVSRSEQLSIEIEEWIYGYDEVLLRTPREIFPFFPPRIEKSSGLLLAGVETARFVVVLEHRLADSDVTLRDIGPSFSPRSRSLEARAAALNTATVWGRNQAVRIKALAPGGYRPAREV